MQPGEIAFHHDSRVEKGKNANIPWLSMVMVRVSRSPIFTLSATISLPDSLMRIFIEQDGMGAAATTGVVPIADVL